MWEKALGLVGDNAELKGILESLEKTSQENVNKIGTLEKDLLKVTETRDTYKLGNKLIKEKLGIDKVDEESITEALKGKTGDVNKEVENYKKQMSQQSQEFETEKNQYIADIRDLKNGQNLSELVSSAGVLDEQTARKDVINIVKGMMSYNDKNEAVYLKEDGTTRFNSENKPFSTADAIQSVLSERPYLKATTAKSGDGVQGNGNSGAKNASEYSEKERLEMFNTNPNLFNQIFKK